MPDLKSPIRPGGELSRRRFLTGCVAVAGTRWVSWAQSRPVPELAGQVGLTTSSFARQMQPTTTGRKIVLWDIPRILREELDMKVIDLNTTTLGSREPQHLDRFRRTAEAAGCVITNLKINDVTLQFEHDDPAIRRPALAEYKIWIAAAARLGVRWLRPMPAAKPPTFSILVDSYRELADFAKGHGITLLVENYRWIQPDPEAIPRLVRALDGQIAASPDIGNWSPEVRYEALSRAFPFAVTCDFKPRGFTVDGEHTAYDLRRCFEIGWRAGFRGPWCIEHPNPNGALLLPELAALKRQLDGWIRAAGGAGPK